MVSISTIARMKAEMDRAADSLEDKQARLAYWEKQKELAERKIAECESHDTI